MTKLTHLSAVAALLASPTAAYTLVQHYAGDNFTSGFNFRTAADYPGSGDPTNGFVNYVSKSQATSQGLVKVVNGQVYLGADSTKTISTSSQGRDSVRLESKTSFTNGLMIADIAHMPSNACGIWPAFWTYNFDEDPYGEIDIIEGTNHQSNNIVSLHTCGTCSFQLGGSDPRPDCNLGGESQGCSDDAATNYDGCGNTAPGASYGDSYNNAGGGVYATLVDSTAVKIWQFNKANVPTDITNGNPNPSSWPTPFVTFKSGSSCNVSKFFKKQTIIINIDFCGSNIDQDAWNADRTCKAAASTCKSYVAQNPSAFTGAYWLFNSIKVYQ